MAEGMEFWVTIAGLVRRWRVIVPALLVAVALGAGLYVSTPVTYTSSATMILTSTEYGGTQSQDPATPSDLINPMLYFNDSLKTTSAILIEAMHTKDVATRLGAGGRTTFRVDDGRTNPYLLGLNGPFLYIVGESTSPVEAERVVQEAQAMMRAKLRDWQSALKAPERTFVSLVDVVPSSTPAPDRGRATKLGLLGFVFGLALSLGIAYLHHRIRQGRQARVVAQPAVAGPPSGSGPGRRLGWRPPLPRRAADDGDAEPVLVPPAATKTEHAPVPMTLPRKTEPDPVPTSPKKNGTAPVPTSQKKKGEAASAPTSPKQKKVEPAPAPTSEKRDEPLPVPTSEKKKPQPVPVPTSEEKSGTAPVPTYPKKTEPALIRRSMKKKAELAVVPATRPARSAVRRPAPPHRPEPALVPVPVKRNGRSRNP
jgi:hypothetical protein